jgi:uncharacterized protein YjiS (DUF1127 family)
MSYSPVFGPCTPAPVCGPSPVPRMPPRSLLRRLGEVLDARVVMRLRVWHARNRLQEAMSGLDHRDLKDIGLSSHDVAAFVAGWQPGRRRVRG